MKQINRELLSLSDVIFSLEEVAPVSSSSTAVIALTRRQGKSLYILSVNVANQPAQVTITLPEGLKPKGKAEVLFEGRTVYLKKSKFADSYAPHERHVYKVDLRK